MAWIGYKPLPEPEFFVPPKKVSEIFLFINKTSVPIVYEHELIYWVVNENDTRFWYQVRVFIFHIMSGKLIIQTLASRY